MFFSFVFYFRGGAGVMELVWSLGRSGGFGFYDHKICFYKATTSGCLGVPSGPTVCTNMNFGDRNLLKMAIQMEHCYVIAHKTQSVPGVSNQATPRKQ